LVEKKVVYIAELVSLSEDDKENVAIAVTEAVANAIFHGNRGAKEKNVYIRFVVTKKLLKIHVRDEGKGFEPEKIKNPLDPENLLKESGRGVFIVKMLMDDVKFEFSEQGTTVILIKKLSTKA
jgi:serine/threonine-protein kinase RsbW